MLWLVPTKNGLRKNNQWTDEKVGGAQAQIAEKVNAGYGNTQCITVWYCAAQVKTSQSAHADPVHP